MGIGGFSDRGRREQWQVRAEIVAAMLPRFEHNVRGETLVFLKPATRFPRFARYHDRHGKAYRAEERHRCWTILHPRPHQPDPVVLLASGLIGYVDPPEGIAPPYDTYFSLKPLRKWDPAGGRVPAADLLRNYLEGALTRYMDIEPGQRLR